MPGILQILAPGAAGGMESVVRMLTTGLAERGESVHAHVVLDPGPAPPLVAQLREGGVDVHVSRIPPRRYDRERAATRALCRDLSIDVVHSHGYRADVVDAPVARRLGLPVVSTVHGFTGGGRLNALYEWLQLRSLRRMDRVLAVSAPLVRLLSDRGVPSPRIRLLPNAYAPTEPPRPPGEAREALDVTDDGPLVGWIGRMSHEKGPDVFVEAAAALATPGVRWVMIGDGPERAAVEAMADTLDGDGRFPGLVPDAGLLVRAFDVLVLSSRTEGTPIVALEAMAAGVPVVATAVGGVPELLADGAGVVVAPERPDALAEAVDRLLADPGAAAAQARRARTRLDARYAVAPWIEAHQALYRELSGVATVG